MTQTVPNHVGLARPFAAPTPARDTRPTRARGPRVVRTRLSEFVPMAPIVLAVLSFAASVEAASEIHRHLFLALSIVFIAVGLGAVGAAIQDPGAERAATRDSAMKDNRSNVITTLPSTAQRSATYGLIDDTFSANDLKAMLMPLLDAEINHYRLACLKSQVRSECSDEGALSRSAQVASTRSEIQAMLQHAAATGQLVRVHSTVHLSIDPVELGGVRSNV